MITITKVFRFDAAHHLPNHPGKCKNLHGHQWKLEVCVRREISPSIDPNTNMVMDFGDLKKLVDEEIISKLDHTCLNDLFEIPTLEEIIEWIALKLKNVLPSEIKLYKLYLWETHDSYAAWKK